MSRSLTKLLKIGDIRKIAVGWLRNLQLNWVLQKMQLMKLYDSAQIQISTSKNNEYIKVSSF
jgi:hypothetical protein